MKTLGQRIRAARTAAGLTQKAVAQHFGIDRVSVTQWESDDSRPEGAKFAPLAELLGVSLETLLNVPEGTNSEASTRPLPQSNASPPIPVNYGTQRLGMFGQAVGGADGKFVLNGQRVMDVLCPPQLFNVPNAYGVFMHGDSMEPRYFAGEAVFVNPHVPVRSGDFVVVQIAGEFEGDDVAGYVKRFISMNSRELVLEQFKPLEDVEPDAPESDRFTLHFPRAKVVAVHKIIASGEV